VATALYRRPGDALSIYVRTTHGLLISRDGGCSFRWVCAEAIGQAPQLEPRYAIASDGSIFAASSAGLRVSRDGGCTWVRAPAAGRLGEAWIDAIDIGPRGEIWVVTADSGRPNDVYRSTDGGERFAPRNLRSAAIWWKSVRVAASAPGRVYVSGYQVSGAPPPGGGPPPPAAHFLRSDDAGATWTRSRLAGVAMGAPPLVRVAAVDPRAADVVYLVSVGARGPAGDRLYRSTDGGATLVEVLATTGPVREVALAGGAVYVAAGGAGYRSTDGGASFAPLVGPGPLGAAEPMRCIAAWDGVVLACRGGSDAGGLAIAASRDRGATWEPALRPGSLIGPLACAPWAPAHARCAPRWAGLQRQLGSAAPPVCAAPTASGPRVSPPAGASGGCGAAAAPGGGLGPVAAAALALLARCAARRRRGA
jgi:photosystem II stability/assembly factor-like uncharacterized protein